MHLKKCLFTTIASLLNLVKKALSQIWPHLIKILKIKYPLRLSSPLFSDGKHTQLTKLKSDTQIARSLDLHILNLNTTQGSYQFSRDLWHSQISLAMQSPQVGKLLNISLLTTIHIHPHRPLATTTLSTP